MIGSISIHMQSAASAQRYGRVSLVTYRVPPLYRDAEEHLYSCAEGCLCTDDKHLYSHSEHHLCTEILTRISIHMQSYRCTEMLTTISIHM